MGLDFFLTAEKDGKCRTILFQRAPGLSYAFVRYFGALAADAGAESTEDLECLITRETWDRFLRDESEIDDTLSYFADFANGPVFEEGWFFPKFEENEWFLSFDGFDREAAERLDRWWTEKFRSRSLFAGSGDAAAPNYCKENLEDAVIVCLILQYWSAELDEKLGPFLDDPDCRVEMSIG